VSAELAKYSTLPASVARSSGRAVAAVAVKKMAVVTSAAESDGSWFDTGCPASGSVIVFHVFVMGVCLVMVLSN